VAALCPRVARDEKNKLRCGMVGINLFNEGDTVEQMRAFAAPARRLADMDQRARWR